MKKILYITIILLYSITYSQQLGEYYSSLDNNKESLNFGIKKPVDFTQRNSAKKDGLIVWEDGSTKVEVFLTKIKKSNFKKLKKSEWTDILKNKKHNFKFIKKTVYKKSDITYQTVDNFPSNLFSYSTEKTNNNILIVVVEGYYFRVNISSSDLSSGFDNFVKSLVNSILFYDQYKDGKREVVGKWKIVKESEGGSKKD
tara:strand:+ start:6755 stop:7351 length:597 start_codon:yes stop_codon:yes gene_type:complete